MERVLLVTKGLDIGGLERTVVDLAVGLARRGVAVEVAVVNDRRDRLAVLLNDNGITLHRLGGSDRVGLLAAVRLARLVAERRFDIVHVHGPLPAIISRLAPRHRPVVTTAHTMWGGLRPFTRLLWTLTCRLDAATIAVSTATAESLPRAIRRVAMVVPHGVDESAIDLVLSRSAQERERRRAGTVVAIAVASHRDVKNYPNLLRSIAVARSKGADVVLRAIGDGPDLERHRVLAQNLGLHDAVRFELPTLDVLSKMAAADFLVVASDFEGQPLVVVEALALGLPVVATAVGRVPELVTSAVGRVVAPGDSEALGSAIADLSLQPDLLRRLADEARQLPLAWTLATVVDAHLKIYRTLQPPSPTGRD